MTLFGMLVYFVFLRDVGFLLQLTFELLMGLFALHRHSPHGSQGDDEQSQSMPFRCRENDGR